MHTKRRLETIVRLTHKGWKQSQTFELLMQFSWDFIITLSIVFFFVIWLVRMLVAKYLASLQHVLTPSCAGVYSDSLYEMKWRFRQVP